MASIKQLLSDIEASPEGTEVAAIFDFDGTIIAGYSAIVFIKEQLKRGEFSAREFIDIMTAMTSFGLGNLGFSGMIVVDTKGRRAYSNPVWISATE